VCVCACVCVRVRVRVCVCVCACARARAVESCGPKTKENRTALFYTEGVIFLREKIDFIGILWDIVSLKYAF
jgi:hypothetical protein